MNAADSTFKITPFWYRRICEISLFVALFLLAFFGYGYISSGTLAGAEHILPLHIAVAAGAIAIASAAAYFLAPREKLSSVTISIYLGLVTTIGLLVATTDPITSPFIALWMLVTIFAGLFGWRLVAFLAAATSAYMVIGVSYFHSIDIKKDLLIFFLAYLLPLFVSWLIWHHKSQNDGEKDRAYNELVRELSQVANKSEIVINAIADGVIAVDGQNVIQLINPAAQEITGWGKQDALKLDYRSVFKLTNQKGQLIDQSIDPIQKVLHLNTSVVDNSLTLESNSGKKILVSVHASPVGQIGAGAIVVFRDITKEKQEEREQAEFISTASHEMRTPVATIEGYLGLALNPNTAAIDDKARTFLMRAQKSVHHLGQLFQDLLDISKVEDGRLSNNPKVIDLVEFTGEIVTNFALQAREKNLVLIYRPLIKAQSVQKLNPVYYVNVDSNHLREVLSNLIENAVKYTTQGNITIDVTGDEKSCTVSVHDTGIGIPPEDIPHLFQKFYRVDNSETRDIGGTGLGLYLCRRLVETMGGRLWIESKLGEGSTFFVQLERLDHEDAIEQIERDSMTNAEMAAPVETQPVPVPVQNPIQAPAPPVIPIVQPQQAPPIVVATAPVTPASTPPQNPTPPNIAV